MQAVQAAGRELTMSKFRIEHGASKVNLVLLKTNIEDTISQDIDLLANWSDNDRKYIVNELLRFALAQEEDFQMHKAALNKSPSTATSHAKVLRGSIQSAASNQISPAKEVLAP